MKVVVSTFVLFGFALSVYPWVMRKYVRETRILMCGALDGLEAVYGLSEPPLCAALNGDVLRLRFTRPVGVAEVQLVDRFGTVKTKDVLDTFEYNFIFIDLPEGEESCYVLRVTNDFGVMQGEFCLN